MHISYFHSGSLSRRVQGTAKDWLSFLLLYNYVIPISLYVTLEMQKFLGGLLIKFDREMWDEATESTAFARTSDLNEELGQIEHLFADKTGTLTQVHHNSHVVVNKHTSNSHTHTHMLEHDGV